MRSPRLVLSALALAAALAAAAPAAARCIDEESFELPAAGAAPVAAPEPRRELATMVAEALRRSQSVGAAQLFAEAAQSDVAEVRAGREIHATLGAGVGPRASLLGHDSETVALQAQTSITVSQLLYDGGRTDRLADWRTQLAESARFGVLSQQEQLAANTVALALERSRFRMQAVVYGQYARKMGCLVEALESIVEADRGRASELVQARKSLQQAQIAMTQAQSQVRQVEIRLRRLVGDGLPSVDGLSSVLLAVPELRVLQDDVLRSPEIAQLEAQAAAAREYAAAVEAGGRPQLSWNVGAAAAVGLGARLPPSQNRSGNLGLGVQLSIPLLDPGLRHAGDAARKRALAAELQRDDALQARRFRVAEVHEQTESAFDRARRLGAVLRDSDQVRNYTLQQWQQLGRRSLFDVMAAEGEHYNLRVAYVNAIHDGEQLNAVLLSLGRGVGEWLR